MASADDLVNCAQDRARYFLVSATATNFAAHGMPVCSHTNDRLYLEGFLKRIHSASRDAFQSVHRRSDFY